MTNNSFSETKTIGYGSRLMDSIKGVLVGFILFIAAFGLLYWNEGRTDLSTVAKDAIEIDASVATAQDGDFVAAQGTLTTASNVGDLFSFPSGSVQLTDGDYVAIERKVEMFAWVEKEDTTSKSNTGGSETQTTTYTYEKQWTDRPGDSANFKVPTDHVNPPLTINQNTVRASGASVGAYTVNLGEIELPPSQAVSLTSSNVKVSGTAQLANSDYIYVGKGALMSPQVGDVRVSYRAVPAGGVVTAFGRVSGTALTKYSNEKGDSVYRIFTGNKGQALNDLHGEYVRSTWILRAVGFVMMWIGMTMVFAPLAVFADFLPIFGSLSKAAIGLVTFVVSLVLSAATIIVSALLHNLIALIVVVVLLIGGFFAITRYKKNQPVAAS